MRHLVCILLGLSSFNLFAAQGPVLGAYYGGRDFPCPDYENIKMLAEEVGSPGGLYNYALCQLREGDLSGGIKTLTKSADKGIAHAHTVLADYYGSNEFRIQTGEGFTSDLNQLGQAISHYKKALELMSKSEYLADGDNRRAEKLKGIRLLTANGLVQAYWEHFAIRIDNHIDGVVSRNDNSTLKSLQNVEDAAERCLNINYNSQIWSQATYKKRMALCQSALNVLRDRPSGKKGILSLEAERLDVAVNNCNHVTNLFDCQEHQNIANTIYDLFMANTDVSRNLLSP